MFTDQDQSFPSVRKFFAVRYNQIWMTDKDQKSLKIIDSQKPEPILDNGTTVNIAFNSVKRALFVLDKWENIFIFDGLRTLTLTFTHIIRAQWSTRFPNHLFVLDSSQNLSIYDIKNRKQPIKQFNQVQVFYVFPHQVENYYFVTIQDDFIIFYDIQNNQKMRIQIPMKNCRYDIIADHEYIYFANDENHLYSVPINEIKPDFQFSHNGETFPNFVGFFENQGLFGITKDESFSFYIMKNGVKIYIQTDKVIVHGTKVKVKCASYNPYIVVTESGHTLYFKQNINENGQEENVMQIIDKNGNKKEEKGKDMADFFVTRIEDRRLAQIEKLAIRGRQLEERQKQYDAKLSKFQNTFQDLQGKMEKIGELKKNFEKLFESISQLQRCDDYKQLKSYAETIKKNMTKNDDSKDQESPKDDDSKDQESPKDDDSKDQESPKNDSK